MKALVYTATQQLEFRDEPDPVAGGQEVMIKVEASGICGSDMHAYGGSKNSVAALIPDPSVYQADCSIH